MNGSKQTQLYNQIYAAIREHILSGKLQVGQLLSERRLAAEFHSSRTPIRYALQKLLQEGLISKREQHGYYVSIATLADLREIYAIRISLESLACYQAAMKMAEEQFVELMSMNYEARQIIEHGGDPKLLYKLQESFLAKINEFSEMPRLRLIQNIINDYILHFDKLFFCQILPECAEIVQANEDLVAAMRQRDQQQIAKVIEARYAISYNYIERKISAATKA